MKKTELMDKEADTKHMDRKEIGNVISLALKAKGLTQSDLAKHLGKSEEHINGVIRGRVGGSVKLYDDIAKYLEIAYALKFPLSK